jgi:ABC-type thiamin/hydroxymethylpyrimidine transport system permease subunit
LAPLLFPTNIKLSPMDYLPFSVIIVVGLGYTIYFFVFARSRRMMLPLIFMAAGVSNAIVAFFGELWEPGEMARHAFVGSVLLHVGVCLAILFWADQFIAARSQQPV